MTARTVVGTVVLPGGVVPTHATVMIELVASTTGRAIGWVPTADLGIAGRRVLECDSNGAWSVDLRPNSLISPSGTYYRLTYTASSDTQWSTTFTIVVPDSAGPHRVEDILSEAPGSLGSSALQNHIDDPSAAHAATAISLGATNAVPADTVAAGIASLARQRPANDMRHVSLICGHDDETVTASSCTITADTAYFKIGDRGWRMTTTGAVTAQLRLDPPGTDDPATFPPADAVGAWVYVDDATKCSSIVVEIYSNEALTSPWTRSFTPSTGWNHIRWRAVAGSLTGWGTVWRVRILAVTSAATFVTIAHVWVECRDKAAFIMIEDGGYKTFLDVAWTQFAQRRWPITWAVDPDKFGTGTGVDARITAAEFETVMTSGNRDSASYHGFTGDVTNTMTAAEIRTDCMQAIKWLARHGPYLGRFWRAAWVQNLAQNALAAQSLMLYGATYTGSTGGTTCWPPPQQERYNLPRYILHGATTSAIDQLFATLQSVNGVVLAYTHGISETGSTHMRQAELDYLLSKLDAGTQAGWLEVVTLEDLFVRSGGQFVDISGRTMAVWTEPDGSTASLALP